MCTLSFKDWPDRNVNLDTEPFIINACIVIPMQRIVLLTLFILIGLTSTMSAQLSIAIPNGGETFDAGSVATIRWTTSQSSTITDVDLEYSTNNGTTWTTIATSVSNTGNYPWSIPISLSSLCLVRVSSTGNSGIKDESNAAFTITMPWTWATQAGGTTSTDYCKGLAIAADSSGNTYVTGSFRGVASFGITTLSNNGGYGVFIAKADSKGIWQWATQALGGSVDYDHGYAIAVDRKGNSYVTGEFSGTISFDSTSLKCIGFYDVFIAKADTNGHWQWAVKAGGPNLDEGRGIAVDESGNSYVIGVFDKSITLGTTTLTSSSKNVFLAKLDSIGIWQWAIQSYGGGSYENNIGIGIALDHSGNSYITGIFSSIISFGGYTLSPIGYNDLFIAKANSNGIWQWATTAGGAVVDVGIGIAVDKSGNSFVTGSFEGTAFFGSSVLSSSGARDVFIAKANPSGVWQWATKAGGADDDVSSGIAIDSSGNSYITGSFNGIANFGGTTLKSSGKNDIFIANVNAKGVLQWATQAGGISKDETTGIADDGKGNTYVVGIFEGSARFSSTTLTCSSNYEMFIAKIGYEPLSPLTILSPNGGEIFYAGSTATIRWTPNLNARISQVDLAYSTDRGIIWKTLATALPNSGSYEWTIPYSVSPECLVRVSGIGTTILKDESNAVFTINPPLSIGDKPIETDEISARLFPNPTQLASVVEFTNKELGIVKIGVFDVCSQKVLEICNKEFPPGRISLVFSLAELPIGQYFIRIETPCGEVSLPLIITK